MSKSIWKKAGVKASRFAYEKKIKTGKNSPQNLKQAGITAYKSGDLVVARTRLDEALKAGADDVNLWKTRANVYNDSRREILNDNSRFLDVMRFASKAYQSFEKSLQYIQNVTNPDFLLKAAISCEQAGKWKQAIVCYSNIFINFPQYKSTSLVALRAACIMAQSGDVAQAIGYMEMVLQSPPGEYRELDIIFVLGRLYELAGRKRDANDSYREVHRQYQGSVRGAKKGSRLDVPTWKSWYKHPLIWYSWAERLAQLDCPILASDAVSEALKRGLTVELKKDASPFIFLARMGIQTSNIETATSSLETGLGIFEYDLELRKLIVMLKPEPWNEVFAGQTRAATSIQSIFRGTAARIKVEKLRNEASVLSRGATSLQKLWRGKKGREAVAKLQMRTKAAVCIQHCYRGHNSVIIVSKRRQRRNAARSIQRMVRRWLWRGYNAIKIETLCRSFLAKAKVRYIRLKKQSAILIQSVWRSYKMRQVAKEIRRRKNASVMVQKVYRSHRCKLRVGLLRQQYWGAVGLQKLYRGYAARKLYRKLQGAYAILLQKSYRGHRDRMRVEYMKTFPNTYETPIVHLMRLVALEPGCTWLASRAMSNKQYLHDAFEGDIIVSESNSIGSDEAKIIACLLFKNKTVKTLAIKNGSVDNDGFIALVNALKFNSCMETFAFGPNNVTVEGFQVFAEALRDHNLRLRSIILEGNILCPESCKLLGGAIGDFFYRNYGHLQALSVSGAKLNDATGVYFANPVYMNHTLQRLDLSNNLIGNSVATVISDGLISNSVLLELNLSNNCISHYGGSALAEALATNSTLRVLNLECNLIQDDAATVLRDSFRGSKSLRSLRLFGNPVGMHIIDAVEAIGIFRSSADIKSIASVSRSLPPLTISPANVSRSNEKHKTKTRSKTSKIEGAAKTSPLVLSPYLDRHLYVGKDTMDSFNVSHKVLPNLWDHRIIPGGEMTKVSPSVKRALPVIKPPPKRIKPPIRPGIPYNYPVLVRPPSMALPNYTRKMQQH